MRAPLDDGLRTSVEDFADRFAVADARAGPAANSRRLAAGRAAAPDLTFTVSPLLTPVDWRSDPNVTDASVTFEELLPARTRSQPVVALGEVGLGAVRARAAVDEVRAAVTRVDDIVAALALEVVVARAAVDGVGARALDGLVAAHLAGHLVVARAAGERVAAGEAEDRVLAGTALMTSLPAEPRAFSCVDAPAPVASIVPGTWSSASTVIARCSVTLIVAASSGPRTFTVSTVAS